MCQNTSSSCCQDYSKLTAGNGIVNIATANPNLDGTGQLGTVFTAGQNGAIVKSVIIKATAPVTTGMVRLYINKPNPAATILYKEVQIPVTPVLNNTPTPTPVLPMYEIKLDGDLKLEAGAVLMASTQVGDSFNVIAEYSDWEYPDPIPETCCNFKQTSGLTGLVVADTANRDLDGTGTIVTAFTAAAPATSDGSLIKNITIKALQSTSINGMIRLFISPDAGTTFYLMREIPIPQTTASAYTPSFKQIIDMNYCLAPDYILGVSTENAESFGITVEGEEWSYPI